MANWAQIDENNIVLQVLVTDNNDPNGDEGYQWLVDNIGGTWIKTSYNTFKNQHLLGGEPLRGNFAAIGYLYDNERDMFYPPSQYNGWVYDFKEMEWFPPVPMPTSPGLWQWDDEELNWVK